MRFWTIFFRLSVAPMLLSLAHLFVIPPVRAESTDPQSVELETADGVLLKGVFYPAEDAGQDTPIVVMLPDEDAPLKAFDPLAMAFQFAVAGRQHEPTSVLAIGLRGQAESTRVRTKGGQVVDREGARLTSEDLAARVRTDMEAVRKFLVKKNDQRELNLNRMAYFGVGVGALVAANAAAVDWEVPILDRGKQGRDVKALVLISPPWKQMRLEILPALRQQGVQSDVGVLVAYGAGDRGARTSAERILRELRRGRATAQAKRDEDLDDAVISSGEAPIADFPGKTSLQATEWLKAFNRGDEARILSFVDKQLAEPELPWIRRRLD